MRIKSKVKSKVLFVGSFKPPVDGKIGGQYFACTSLLQSDLGNDVEFILIDSTLQSIHVKSPLFRLNKIAARFFTFLFKLWFSRIDSVVIFSSSGLSFIEKGAMAMLAKWSGKKVIFFPRSGLVLNDIGNKFFRFYLRLVFKSCNQVLCQSIYWKNVFRELVSNVSESRFTVIENWLPDSYFFDLPVAKAESIGLLKILYFNRIEVDKGIYDFVEAIKIASRQTELIADIYGDGREVTALKDSLRDEELNKNIQFKGWLKEDKRKVVSSYDVYVFSSHSEGFPNALLEVMALGVPIISTSVGAVNDIIVHCRNGMLVSIKSPEEIAKCIVDLSLNRHLLATFSTLSRERVQRNNRLSIAVRQFREILLEM